MKCLFRPAAAAALLALGACASADHAPIAEQGYARGSLAVAAIARGDYERAETMLERSPLPEAHPARLMNLGTVYARTGRQDLARQTWLRVLRSERDAMVETAEGRYASARDLARQALAGVEVRTAAR
jgi:tetratricopeptide (TPR) repeat protein